MRGKREINAVSRPVELVFHIVMILFCLLCIVPFIFVVIISFSSQDSIRQIGYAFVPTKWSLEAYDYIWKLGDQLWRSFFNSFFITVVGTLFSLLVTSGFQVSEGVHILLFLYDDLRRRTCTDIRCM